MNIRKHFKSKKIVYTARYAPGELLKVFRYKGKKYVRIGFTNRIRINGMMPVTDVLFSDVTAVRKLPSNFKKKCLKLIGIKAKAVFYKIR